MNSVVVFYFSGHGIEVAGRPYIASIGSERLKGSGEEIPKSFVAVSDVAAELAKRFAAVYIVFDASRGSAPHLGQPDGFIPIGSLFGAIPQVRSVVFASGPNEGPLDAGPAFKTQSPFSRAFASQVDSDWPDLDTILARVRERVNRATAGRQTPDWYRAPLEKKHREETRLER